MLVSVMLEIRFLADYLKEQETGCNTWARIASRSEEVPPFSCGLLQVVVAISSYINSASVLVNANLGLTLNLC